VIRAAHYSEGELPELPREFRAAWVATVDNIDWPLKRGEPTELARRELHDIVLTAARLHLNAILLQVRPSADALYDSRLEPWSEYLTGRQGTPPNPRWDPLAEAIRDAHAHGIELHAWFNPFRAQSPAQKGPNAPNHVSVAHPGWVKKYGPFLWLDPGDAEARAHSIRVFMDVVKRYDVDGIVIDDYFYPYKEKGPSGQILDFPDDLSWRRYRAESGQLSREDWRRDGVNRFIRDLYANIKKEKPWVKFGISPFGIYRPGYPSGIKAGVDQYADLYADAKLWLERGWCDYIAPQLYWPLAQKAQAYSALLDWWVSVNTLHRHVWPANNTEGLGRKNPKEILAEIACTRREGAGGNIHFSFKILRQNANGLADALTTGPYAIQAAVPESPWLEKGAKAEVRFAGKDHEVRANKATRWIYWSQKLEGQWTPWSTQRPEQGPRVALPLDRYGRAGKPAFEQDD
jgi:uncharacterized lipoprotein YddW (UPF0748 family)